MSTSSNPFGGWSNAGMGPSRNGGWDSGSNPPPSVFGALPGTPSSFNSDESITLTFTAFTPSILNSVLIDSNSNILFRVDSNTSPIFTMVKDRENKNVALIEWRSNPTVEIRGVSSKQNIRSWLALSADGMCRIMTVGNARYTWAPSGNNIFLYTTLPLPPQVLVKVSKTQGSVTLEITRRAIELRLLEASVVATVLLQSGRNID